MRPSFVKNPESRFILNLPGGGINADPYYLSRVPVFHDPRRRDARQTNPLSHVSAGADHPRRQDKRKPERNRGFRAQPRGTQFFDTFLRVADSSGKVLAEDDDGGVDLNSLLLFTPPRDDTYRIVVTTFAPNVTGAYTLIVRH
jgi:hypothetical protein